MLAAVHLVELVDAARAAVAQDDGARLQARRALRAARAAVSSQRDGQARRGRRVAADVDRARRDGRRRPQHLRLAQARVADH